MSTAWTIILSIAGSSAIFGFIQFIIQRYDKKSDKLKNIIEEIQGIRNDLSVLDNKIERSQIIECRIRILRASDEIRRSVMHSKEYFDQINDDITKYEQYCDENPKFRNNRAVKAIENINEIYKKALHENNFL